MRTRSPIGESAMWASATMIARVMGAVPVTSTEWPRPPMTGRRTPTCAASSPTCDPVARTTASAPSTSSPARTRTVGPGVDRSRRHALDEPDASPTQMGDERATQRPRVDLPVAIDDEPTGHRGRQQRLHGPHRVAVEDLARLRLPGSDERIELRPRVLDGRAVGGDDEHPGVTAHVGDAVGGELVEHRDGARAERAERAHAPRVRRAAAVQREARQPRRDGGSAAGHDPQRGVRIHERSHAVPDHPGRRERARLRRRDPPGVAVRRAAAAGAAVDDGDLDVAPHEPERDAQSGDAATDHHDRPCPRAHATVVPGLRSRAVMAEPRISVGLPQYIPDESPAIVAPFAARAEELGFSGLWTVDSVPGSATSRGTSLEGLHVLTAASVATRTIGLGVSVIVLPARNPAQLARELATLDVLSGGRLTVGVGLGRADPVGASLGFPDGSRVRRFNENLQIMRSLWSGKDVSFDGELYSFADVTIGPKPVQHPGPPVWFGAGAPPALRRAARLGDGWMGAGSSSSAAFAEQVQILREALHEQGRDPGAFPISKRVYLAVEDSEARARERMTPRLDGFYGAPGMTDRVAVCGSPEACAAQLLELVESGAGELLLNPVYDYMAQLEAFAQVAALLRAA